ncbi:MAG: Ca2+-dependent phosphoinositide-specific phospholipase C [Tenericutes bacterium]|nr:Ca2+-dependent phosphoinositide-specific phospholipase C [Mycoplasmatota bacterium]
MIKILKIILIVFLSFVTLFFLIVMRLFAVKIYDSVVQTSHMKRLNNYYEDNSFVPVDENEFVNFDLTDESIKLNEIQILATHNSYKKAGTALGRLFVGLGDSFDEARALKYGYNNLTTQFESGIRSMEFDVRLRKDSFVLTHVPLVDNSSVAPNFELALEEIDLFSTNHPNHIPIIILMEIKNDWMILDHALQNIESEELEKLNSLLIDKLGNRLYQPNEMLESGKTLRETIQTTGWPSVSSLLGKIIFVLHPGDFTDMYYELDSTLETQAMFIGSYSSQIDQDYASFVVHNQVDVEFIQSLVEANLIVRTRIDSNLLFEQQRYIDAISSGAQILTSDFTIGRSDLKLDEMIYLPNNKLIIKRINE